MYFSSEGSRCSMMYSRASSRCEQKTVKRSLMVVDPSKRERGVFTAEFVIPTECACAVAKIGDVYTMRPIGSDDDDESVEDRNDEIGEFDISFL